MKHYNELIQIELRILRENLEEYMNKYCKVSFGTSSLLLPEEFYKLFGLNKFILNEKTNKYIGNAIWNQQT